MDETQLREVLGEPAELVRAKIADRLNPLTRQFIERSPFVVVATGRPDGGLDVSPRGDPAGFVRILDERTLLLPDRPGNKLADTLTNLLEDDRIALLFLIPGVNDTFRVNGRARIVDDPELLAASEVEGKAPQLGILVDGRGGVHAVPESAAPLRPLEPGAARRALGAAELGRDPPRDRRSRARRRGVRGAPAPSGTAGARASTRAFWRSQASSSCSTLRRCASLNSNRARSRRASATSSFSTAASRCSRAGIGWRSWRRSQRRRLTCAASTVPVSHRCSPSACQDDPLRLFALAHCERDLGPVLQVLAGLGVLRYDVSSSSGSSRSS